MKITDEIKAKVFAQYLGSKAKSEDDAIVIVYGIMLPESSPLEENFHVLTYEDHLGHNQEMIEDVTLLLKPLSSITDEDAIELCKMFGFVNSKIVDRNDYKIALNDDSYTVVISYKGEVTVFKNQQVFNEYFAFHAYQFLISKGYDMPNYLLGRKTLIESKN